MKLYEIIFIARQDMAPSQVDDLTEYYSNIVTEEGGIISKVEYCGLRILAYPIKKNPKGHYVLLGIKAAYKSVQEIERKMRISSDVLRYLTVKVDAHIEGPSSLLKSSKNSNLRDVSLTVTEETRYPKNSDNNTENN